MDILPSDLGEGAHGCLDGVPSGNRTFTALRLWARPFRAELFSLLQPCTVRPRGMRKAAQQRSPLDFGRAFGRKAQIFRQTLPATPFGICRRHESGYSRACAGGSVLKQRRSFNSQPFAMIASGSHEPCHCRRDSFLPLTGAGMAALGNVGLFCPAYLLNKVCDQTAYTLVR